MSINNGDSCGYDGDFNGRNTNTDSGRRANYFDGIEQGHRDMEPMVIEACTHLHWMGYQFPGNTQLGLFWTKHRQKLIDQKLIDQKSKQLSIDDRIVEVKNKRICDLTPDDRLFMREQGVDTFLPD